MTWSAFAIALRNGLTRPAARRTAQQRAARSTSTQAIKAVPKKKKTMEEWDYRCIGVAYAWH